MARAELNNDGFSLIEVLVVSGLSTMLLLTISALFMTFLVGSANTSIRRTLSREGDSTINQIEYSIRNARSIDSCLNNTVTFTTIDQTQSTLSVQDDQIVLTKETETPIYLTSNSVQASAVFDCAPVGSKTYVTVTMDLQKLKDGAPVGTAETFKTSVQVRN